MKKLKGLFTINGKPDFKSIIGLLAIISTGLASVKVDPMSWSTWNIMFSQLLGIIHSPAMIISFVIAIYWGWARNNQEETK